MNYIDFHIHIDFYDNPDNIIQYYEKRKIYCIFVTNLPELFESHLNKYKNLKYIRIAIGFHPEMISQYDFNKNTFNKCVSYTNYVGEVGLDSSLKQSNQIKKQLDVFNYVTQKEFSKGRIYSIHSKGFELETLEILVKNKVKSAVFHWYSGKISAMKDISQAGYYFSVNPYMLRSNKGKKIIQSVPLDRILFETDGPFTRVDKKIVTPDLIPAAYKEISKELGINFKEVVYNNFKKLLIQSKFEREQSL